VGFGILVFSRPFVDVKILDEAASGFPFSVSSRSAMISTQKSLVFRLQNGGSEVDWMRFYELYEGPILALAAARSLNQTECQDVLQETMVKMLHRGFAEFDRSKGRFTSWLFRFANHCIIDALRRRSREQKRQESLDAPEIDGGVHFEERLADPTPTPAESAEHRGQIALLIHVADSLVQRRCFHAKTVEIFKALVFEEQEPEQVAARFSTKRGNVDQAKSTVLAKIRKVMVALDEGFSLDEAIAQ
jgi:RNA polymerase sigma factor (sigma-70 family)